MRRRAVDRSVGKHATIGCFSWASTDRRPPGSAPERVRRSARRCPDDDKSEAWPTIRGWPPRTAA